MKKLCIKHFILIFILFPSFMRCSFGFFNNFDFPIHDDTEKVKNGKVLNNPGKVKNIEEYQPIENTLNLSRFYEKDLDSLNYQSDIVEYNLKSGSEKITIFNSSILNRLQSPITPFEGILDRDYFNEKIEESRGLMASYVFPPDDRQKVTSSSAYPWSSICKLYITAQNGSQYIGSGAIIDEFHVLTCGHCVFIHDAGGWAEEVKVVPGKNGDYEPFGHAYSTDIRSYTGWTQDEKVEDDWAVVTLDRSIGDFTGWLGRMTDDPSSTIYTGSLDTAGYPGDLDLGENMYKVSDDGDRADEYNHWFWMDTAGGQSGSPVWTTEGDNRYIISILAYGYEDGADANFGTRLNSDKFDQINTWLEEDASISPDDKAELSEGDSYSSFSTTDVISGQTNFEIYFDVKNSGTATASNFSVNFYASEDLTISTSDYLIGTTAISILYPYNTINADWIGVFPSGVPEGYYYVGLIIDSENSIDEINENNNNIIISYTRIDVESPPLIFDPIPMLLGILALVGIIIIIGILIRSKIKTIPDLNYREFYHDLFEEGRDLNLLKKDKTPDQLIYPRFCPACGTESGKGAYFCQNCGKIL